MGKWIEKKREPHRCSPPIIWPWRGTGSLWQCGCGQHWEIWDWMGGRIWGSVTKITPPPPPPPPSSV